MPSGVSGSPGRDAAENGVEVVAAQREEDSRGRGAQLGSVLVTLAVGVDEMADLRQQLLHQHGLIQTQAVFRLLRKQGEKKNHDIFSRSRQHSMERNDAKPRLGRWAFRHTVKPRHTELTLKLCVKMRTVI